MMKAKKDEEMHSYKKVRNKMEIKRMFLFDRVNHIMLVAMVGTKMHNEHLINLEIGVYH